MGKLLILNVSLRICLSNPKLEWSGGGGLLTGWVLSIAPDGNFRLGLGGYYHQLGIVDYWEFLLVGLLFL